jgi:hypothetical protein
MNKAAFITPNKLNNKYNGGSIASSVLFEQMQNALGAEWTLNPICVKAANDSPLFAFLSKIANILRLSIPSYKSLPSSLLEAYDLLIIDTVLPLTCLSGYSKRLPTVFIWHNVESQYVLTRTLGLFSRLYLFWAVRNIELSALSSRCHHFFLSSDDRLSFLSMHKNIAGNSSVLQLDTTLLQRKSGILSPHVDDPLRSDLPRVFAGLKSMPCGFFMGTPNNANLESISNLVFNYKCNEWHFGPIILVGEAWERFEIVRSRTDLFLIIDHIEDPSCFSAFGIPLIIPHVHSCGIKIKVLLFLSLGVPIVSVYEAFTGLSGYINKNCVIIEDASRLPQALGDKSLDLALISQDDNLVLLTYGTPKEDLRKTMLAVI